MNLAILVGNLTKDPELRTTQNGLSVCSFTIACQRKYANQQGQREADFINCVAWRGTAEFIQKYFIKGNRIGVTGTIQTRSYEAQDGTKRYVTEVLVDSAEFVSAKAEGSHVPPQGTATTPAQNTNPAPVPQVRQMSTHDISDFEEVDDQDLPF